MGVQLELSSSKLDEIEASNHGDCIHCFISVFSEWEKRLSSPYSWSTIVDALKAPSIEENKVASELIASLENNYETELVPNIYKFKIHIQDLMVKMGPLIGIHLHGGGLESQAGTKFNRYQCID